MEESNSIQHCQLVGLFQDASFAGGVCKTPSKSPWSGMLCKCGTHTFVPMTHYPARNNREHQPSDIHGNVSSRVDKNKNVISIQFWVTAKFLDSSHLTRL